MTLQFKRIAALEWFHNLNDSEPDGTERDGTEQDASNSTALAADNDRRADDCLAATPPRQPAQPRGTNLASLSRPPVAQPTARTFRATEQASPYLLAARLSFVSSTYRPKGKNALRSMAQAKPAKKTIVRRHVRLTKPGEHQALALKALAAIADQARHGKAGRSAGLRNSLAA